jgi:glycosyltransferase involved in cell wall biosynthesis
MIKLYGVANGYGSRAQVTRGFRETIEKMGLLTEFVALDQDDGSFDRRGDGAPIAIMTGPLEWSQQISPTHKRRFALVAPNATKIPKQVGLLLKDFYTDIIVPSQWCVQAVRDLGLPVWVVPHGVFSKEIGQANRDRTKLFDDFYKVPFSMVHFSTSNGSRKGTIELVEGFQLFRQRYPTLNVSLVLVMDQPAQQRLLSLYDGSMDGVTITPRLDGPFHGSGMDPKCFADGMRLFHAVIQPSRGEAFGMIPLEARAAGVPTIVTCCSGHEEHVPFGAIAMARGVIIIKHGEDAPIEDCDGAMAPSVTPEAIADAIDCLTDKSTWAEAESNVKRCRKAVLADWDWIKIITHFINKIRE